MKSLLSLFRLAAVHFYVHGHTRSFVNRIVCAGFKLVTPVCLGWNPPWAAVGLRHICALQLTIDQKFNLGDADIIGRCCRNYNSTLPNNRGPRGTGNAHDRWNRIGNLIGIQKVSLEAWARCHAPPEIPDVELAQWAKSHMALLYETDWELFKRYAVTDAEIAARYFRRILEFMEQCDLNIRPIPATASSLAVRLCEKATRDAGVDLDKALGIEIQSRTVFNELKGHKVTVKTHRMCPDAAELEAFAIPSPVTLSGKSGYLRFMNNPST